MSNFKLTTEDLQSIAAKLVDLSKVKGIVVTQFMYQEYAVWVQQEGNEYLVVGIGDRKDKQPQGVGHQHGTGYRGQ